MQKWHSNSCAHQMGVRLPLESIEWCHGPLFLVFCAGLSQSRQQDVRDIDFSTVVCKKDTSEVFKNTIKEWLTSD
jgi:hypothetical protein